jgi:hypothetical protein
VRWTGCPSWRACASQKRPDGWHFSKGEAAQKVWAAWFRDLVKLAILTGVRKQYVRFLRCTSFSCVLLL